ncbi:MAG: efflux RND transporter periplasmic adaptor subunit [Pseudomonadota bacterium]
MKKRSWIWVTGFILTLLPWAHAGENIGALGRIAPAGGIVHLAGPPGVTIERILVDVDEQVVRGAPLVAFASKQMLDLEVAIAQQNLREADVASAKAIDIQTLRVQKIDAAAASAIALQQAKLKAVTATHAFTDSSLARLLEAGSESYSAQQKELREYEVNSARINMEIAQKELAQLEVNRKSDLALATLELERLRLDRDVKLAQTRQQLDAAEQKQVQSTLSAPFAGTILDILQHAGEKTGGSPIIQIADLSKMVVIAEVFQGDVLRVRKGMAATITSKSMPGALKGTVTGISRIIQGRSKVAEVTIALEIQDTAARLINLEVEVSLADIGK